MTDPLTRADFQTRTWERFEALLRERREMHRTENDKRLDPEKTAFLRGRIAEVNELLALAERALAPSGSAGQPPPLP